MLLEVERERLLAILQSRSASHEERKRAREALELAYDEAERSGIGNGAPQTIAEDLHAEIRLKPDPGKSG